MAVRPAYHTDLRADRSAPFGQPWRQIDSWLAIPPEPPSPLYSDSWFAPIAQTPGPQTTAAPSRRGRLPRVFRNPRKKRSCPYGPDHPARLPDPSGYTAEGPL